MTLKNTGFKRKISLLLIAALTIYSLVISLLFTRTIGRYERLLYQEAASSLSLMSKDLSNQLNGINSTSTYLATDQLIQQSLASLGGSLTDFELAVIKSRCLSQLYSYLNTSPDIISISLYTDRFTICCGRSSRQEPPEALEAIGQQLKGSNGKELWIPSRDPEDSSVLLCRQIRKIQNLSLDVLGTVVIRVDLDTIVSRAQTSNSHHITLLDGETSLYSSQSTGESDIHMMLDTPGGYRIVRAKRADYFLSVYRMPYPGWLLGLSVPYNDIFSSILLTRLSMLLLIPLIGFLIMLMARPLIGSLTCHLHTLTQKIESLHSGNLTPIDVGYDYTNRTDEFGRIHQAYDRMLNDIQNLTQENYQKQLLLKDAQLKALEQQINPHFLYNVLDTIHWRAKVLNDSLISTMVESLANLLYYTLSEDRDLVPLENELNLVDSYVNIQKLRFTERMVYTCHVDSDLLTILVPKLCLQPLLENAIKYGVERCVNTCNIHLDISGDQNTAVIRLTNDGPCIPEKAMELLSIGKLTPSGNSVGLQNIDSRIKLIFGKEYGIQLTVEKGLNTVQVNLPITFPQS